MNSTAHNNQREARATNWSEWFYFILEGTDLLLLKKKKTRRHWICQLITVVSSRSNDTTTTKKWTEWKWSDQSHCIRQREIQRMKNSLLVMICRPSHLTNEHNKAAGRDAVKQASKCNLSCRRSCRDRGSRRRGRRRAPRRGSRSIPRRSTCRSGSQRLRQRSVTEEEPEADQIESMRTRGGVTHSRSWGPRTSGCTAGAGAPRKRRRGRRRGGWRGAPGAATSPRLTGLAAGAGLMGRGLGWAD